MVFVKDLRIHHSEGLKNTDAIRKGGDNISIIVLGDVLLVQVVKRGQAVDRRQPLQQDARLLQLSESVRALLYVA
ncbi:MAG: hypothetical protein ACPHX8_08885 [Candidatus Poseidoniaceae archaeon]